LRVESDSTTTAPAANSGTLKSNGVSPKNSVNGSDSVPKSSNTQKTETNGNGVHTNGNSHLRDNTTNSNSFTASTIMAGEGIKYSTFVHFLVL